MKAIKYELMSATVTICEVTAISYGIRCLVNGAEYLKYPDVLPDKARVKELARLCNKLEVYPIHVPEILEDFLG